MTELLVVALEASADLHGAAVLRELRALRPEVRAFGAGGPRMRAEGLEALVHAEDLSVMGIAEVLPALPRLLDAMDLLGDAARDRRPRAALLIDSPDFNLRLATRLKRLRVPVAYFIGPSVWAWRTGRVRRIARDIARMLVILPFEAAFYARHGVEARYVGNPLADELRDAPDGAPELGALAAAQPVIELGALAAPEPVIELGALAAPAQSVLEVHVPGASGSAAGVALSARGVPRPLPVPIVSEGSDTPVLRGIVSGVHSEDYILALMPGSRRQEIRRIWPAMLAAARLVQREFPGLRLVVPIAPTLAREDFDDAEGIEFVSDARAVLRSARAAIVKSGTSTLEAALAGTPLVCVYRTSWLTWLVGRALVRVRFVSLPNLLAQRPLIPELLQGDCTPERIAAAIAPLLRESPERAAQLAGLQRLRDELAPPGSPNAARAAAREVSALLGL